MATVGGFRPTGDAFATHFGMTPSGVAEEEWPESGGKPMMFIRQFNLTNAPVAPTRLEDIKPITFFVEPETAELDNENGGNWMLRAYKSLDGLTLRKGFECKREESGDAKPERTKIGGKPAEIQSEPWWEYREHPSEPEFCVPGCSGARVERCTLLAGWRPGARISDSWIFSFREKAGAGITLHSGLCPGVISGLVENGVWSECSLCCSSCGRFCCSRAPRGG
jgi:hypothetical protein